MATAGVTRAVTAGNREIELLNEHRSRLIADVVTGKLDVREAAARLPDETYDLDPHDEDAGEAEQFADEPNDAAAEEAA